MILTWPATRQRASALACAHSLRRGHVPSWLQSILDAPTPTALALKDSDSQPRVPAGNPDGGQWTSAGGESDGGYVPHVADIDDKPIKPVYPIEDALAAFMPLGRLRSAFRTARSTSKPDLAWRLGSFKSDTKWANQMQSRNWTDEQITDVQKTGGNTKAKTESIPAIARLFTLMTRPGRYIVRDDQTKEILQLSGKGKFKPPKKIGK